MSTCMISRPSGSWKPRWSASPTAGGPPNGSWSLPCGFAVPSMTPMSVGLPPRSTTYAAGRAAGIMKSSSTWKTTASSVAVRSVPTSVAPPAISIGRSAGALSRKRRLVCAPVGPSSRMPSSSMSATCSLSGTRLSR